MRFLAALLVVLGGSNFAVSALAGDQPLTVERMFADPPLGGVLPGEVKWLPDGGSFSYLEKLGDGKEARTTLWIEDATTGERQPFLTDAELAAFGEAWQAMTLQMLKANQQLAASMMRSWWPTAAARRGKTAAPMAQAAAQWQHAALDILGQGIRPVHRRAVANAKRLGRSRTR